MEEVGPCERTLEEYILSLSSFYLDLPIHVCFLSSMKWAASSAVPPLCYLPWTEIFENMNQNKSFLLEALDVKYFVLEMKS